jgi:hypothetical protein
MISNSTICFFIILSPLQIIGGLTFSTSNLIVYLIKTFVKNIIKFKSFWIIFINKASHNKTYDILHNFMNKISGQTWE